MNQETSVGLVKKKLTAPKINVAYPEVKELKESLFLQVRINELIRSVVYNIIHDRIKDRVEQPEINGDYKIACNKYNILSIIFFIDETNKDGYCCSSRSSLTLDLTNARVYDIKDLFSNRKGLTKQLNTIVLNKIRNGNTALRKCFTGIDKDQEYYFNGKELVLYYQPCKYSAATKGIFEINLPLDELHPFVGSDSPLSCFIELKPLTSETADKNNGDKIKNYPLCQKDICCNTLDNNGDSIQTDINKSNLYIFPEN